MGGPILIGIHGVKGSGKSATADFINEFAASLDPALSFCQRGFADKAKLSFARQFFPAISMEAAIAWVDKFKNSDVHVVIESPFQPTAHIADVSFRQCLAQFATEGARDVYGRDFWVDQLLPTSAVIDENDVPLYSRWRESFLYVDHSDPALGEIDLAQICVITDERFENENERISDLGGFNWKLRRKEAEDAVIAEAKAQGREVHESELGLPDALFDVVLDNNSSFDHLRLQIFAQLAALTLAEDQPR